MTAGIAADFFTGSGACRHRRCVHCYFTAVFTADKGVSLPDLHFRQTEGHGRIAAFRCVGNDFLTLLITHAEQGPSLHSGANIVENRALCAVFTEFFCHSGSAESQDRAAGNDAFTSAFAAVINGIVRAVSQQTDADVSAVNIDAAVRIKAVRVLTSLIDDGQCAAADTDVWFFFTGRSIVCITVLCLGRSGHLSGCRRLLSLRGHPGHLSVC